MWAYDALVYGTLCVPAAWLVWLVVSLGRRAHRAEKQAKLEEAAEQRGWSPLKDGDTVLKGVVKLADSSDVAVRIEISQEGQNREGGYAGTAWHTWVEVVREIFVRPFLLLVSGNRQVRVEPDARVILVDEPNITRDGSQLHRRRRIRELSPGEEVYVHGLLVGAAPGQGGPYRGAPWEDLRLVPCPGTRMLISSRPLGEHFRTQARFLRRWSGRFASLLVVHIAIATPFLGRLCCGRAVMARVVEAKSWQEGRGSSDNRVVATLDAPGGKRAEFRTSVDEATFQSISKGDSVPFVYVPWWASNYNYGAHAVVGRAVYVLLYLLAMLVLWLTISYFIKAGDLRPWYQRKRYVEDGLGPLP